MATIDPQPKTIKGEENLRSTVCYAFDFHKIRFAEAEEVRVGIYVLCIPPFHKGQPVNSSLLFLSESFQGILAMNIPSTQVTAVS